MQLSEDLDAFLCQRYGDLYAERFGQPQEAAMARGFEVGDGWFGIIDSLSELIVRGADARGAARPVVQQVKEKFGALRFHVERPVEDEAAFDLAENMSQRVCEVSGKPGRLCMIGRRRLATLAPGVVLPGLNAGARVSVLERAPDPQTGGMSIPPLPVHLLAIEGWRHDVLLGPVDVPIGWLDLVDAILNVVQRQRKRSNLGRVTRIWTDGNSLRLDWNEDVRGSTSTSDLAALLSRRLNPDSGKMT